MVDEALRDTLSGQGGDGLIAGLDYLSGHFQPLRVYNLKLRLLYSKYVLLITDHSLPIVFSVALFV